MTIWLLKDGEHLPVQPGTRPMRTGMLAEALVSRGHTVVWWCSTFSHQHKSLLYTEDTSIALNPRLTLRLLHGGSYRRNVSLRRYLHHGIVGRRFRRHAASMAPPDIIVTAFPTIDLACEAVRYGVQRGIPVIVDVRDLWPDIIVEKSPRALQRPLRWLLARDFARTRSVFRHADGIVATSNGYLRWALNQAGRASTPADRVLYLGFPRLADRPAEPSPRIEQLRRRLEGKVVFTFVGSFGNSYELMLLCDAARRAQSLEHVHFVLAGDGQQREAVARAASTLPNLTLLEWLTAAEAGELLRRSDVGLVPCRSTADTMPNKVFEYLAAGLPVLSSLEGEMEELLARNEVGFSYRCGDAERLVQLVGQLAGAPALRARLASNATALFEREFTAQAIYATYSDHVERLLASTRRERLAV